MARSRVGTPSPLTDNQQYGRGVIDYQRGGGHHFAQQLCATFALSGAPAVGGNVYSPAPPGFNDAKWLTDLADIIDRALVGQIIMGHEMPADTSDEAVPLTLSISAAPLYDNRQSFQTRILGVVAVLNDITSHKQLEKLKDEFVSIVSHELRTPLTTIKGYTQHLIRRIERRLRGISATQPANAVAELPESYDLRSLNIVQSQTDHLERLVNDLLDLSRVQWGELRLQ